MTLTVGISAELGVIRGVLLSTEPMAQPEVLRSVEQRVDDGGSIVGVLNALAETEPGTADVAVAYHSARDRKAIVSELASGRWRTSSLVSTGSAMSALVGGTSELDEFRTVVLLNVVDRTSTAVVVGAERGQILASESWPTRLGAGTADEASTEVSDADPMSETIGRVRSMLASVPTHPSVVALCGSRAAEPEIATVLRDELGAPVVLLPDFADATARGAALVAAGQVRNRSAAPSAVPRRPGRIPVVAAVAAALLVVSGFAVTELLDDSSPAVNTGPPSAASPSPPVSTTAVEATTEAQVPRLPAAAAPPSTLVPNPAPDPGRSPVVDPAPVVPAAPVPQWNPELPDRAPATAPNPSAPSPSASPPDTATPSESPTPTRVGEPDPNGLFPGESPPPPAGADPAAERAWWDNHWNLKQRWLHGN
ncbi:hypothetical protein [Nocardia mangyaensis]|uniref:hypothetical protein n=1 Tax=Nocardia mangyaensis TaxID=2213200 RepID=UPI002676F4E6|nr:hypothetical protein [Nocardia mangyaensis]MDO3647863.1 hypothetical protein [Nocardia mangyaensis]